ALAMAAPVGRLRGAEVRVVDDADKPVADVMVACVSGAKDAALSNADGVATVPDACREVYCDRGGRVNDQVKLVGGKATCHSGAGVVMTVVAPPGRCAADCWVVVIHADIPWPLQGRVAGGAPRRISSGRISWEKPATDRGHVEAERVPGRWTSLPLAPGHLRISVTEDDPNVIFGHPRGTSPWTCET